MRGSSGPTSQLQAQPWAQRAHGVRPTPLQLAEGRKLDGETAVRPQWTGKDDLARRGTYKVWEGSRGRTGLSLKAEEGGQGGQWV